jgi:hypothetical protein
MGDVMEKQLNYENKVYLYGRITTTIFLASTMLLPLMLWFKWGLLPTKEGFIAGITIVATIMIPVTLGEFLSYAPIIGSAGYFVMLLSGNWMNIKIPSSIVGLQSVDIDSSSEEGEVLSTMIVAASAIVTEIIILAGVILLQPFSAVFAVPSIKMGFSQIAPALFGALLLTSILSNWKTVLVPTVVGILIVKLNLAGGLYNIPIMIFISIIITLGLLKIGFFSKKKMRNADETTEKGA